jgi:hypothetical protein
MPSANATRVVPPVPGSGEAEQVIALCNAIDAITVSMDESAERLPDEVRPDVNWLPAMFGTVADEIRNRLGDWLIVEEQIAAGQAERCGLCGDVLPLASVLSHRADLHQGAAR